MSSVLAGLSSNKKTGLSKTFVKTVLNSSVMIFLFDIDGTITIPQKPVSTAMVDALLTLNEKHSVYLVTGNDYELGKANNQIVEDFNNLSGVFTCQGSELWEHGKCTYKRQTHFPNRLRHELRKIKDTSEYPSRTGKHINYRTGMLNFSVVGRACSDVQRLSYFEWDRSHGERRRTVEHLTHMFPDFDFTIGGEISIDISPKGTNKSQVVRYLRDKGREECFSFFGDKTQPGGNDYPLAQELRRDNICNKIYTITDPKETLKIIKNSY